MSDERCSDLNCPCRLREELYDQGLQRQLTEKLVELSESGEGMLQYKPPTEEQAQANWDAMYPPTLRQRIWAKFCALAQWVRPGRN